MFLGSQVGEQVSLSVLKENLPPEPLGLRFPGRSSPTSTTALAALSFIEGLKRIRVVCQGLEENSDLQLVCLGKGLPVHWFLSGLGVFLYFYVVLGMESRFVCMPVSTRFTTELQPQPRVIFVPLGLGKCLRRLGEWDRSLPCPCSLGAGGMWV